MARKAELEAAIIESPDAAAPYVVYADWLQTQGDPRGELIGVQLALETALDAADLAALGSLGIAIELAPRVPPVVETLDERPRSI